MDVRGARVNMRPDSKVSSDGGVCVRPGILLVTVSREDYIPALPRPMNRLEPIPLSIVDRFVIESAYPSNRAVHEYSTRAEPIYSRVYNANNGADIAAALGMQPNQHSSPVLRYTVENSRLG